MVGRCFFPFQRRVLTGWGWGFGGRKDNEEYLAKRVPAPDFFEGNGEAADHVFSLTSSSETSRFEGHFRPVQKTDLIS